MTQYMTGEDHDKILEATLASIKKKEMYEYYQKKADIQKFFDLRTDCPPPQLNARASMPAIPWDDLKHEFRITVPLAADDTSQALRNRIHSSFNHWRGKDPARSSLKLVTRSELKVGIYVWLFDNDVI